MKQLKVLFFLGFFLFILAGCTTDNQDEHFTLTLTMSDAISDVTFTNQDDDIIAARTSDDITYILSEIPNNQTININHSEATFTPNVVTVDGNQTEEINVSYDLDDTIDPIDDDHDDDGFEHGDNDDTDIPDDSDEDDTDDTNDDNDNTDDDIDDDTDDTDDDTDDDADDNTDDDTDDNTDANQTVHVDSYQAFNDALNSDNVETIVLDADINASVYVDRLVQLDLNGFTIGGNLTIQYDDTGTLTISEGTITGKLELYTPNMTVYNYANASGYVDVYEVSSNSYYENGFENQLRVYAENSHIYIQSEVIDFSVLADHVTVTLDAHVARFSAEATFIDITVTNTHRIREAIIHTPDILLDGIPEILSGTASPQFTLPVVDHIEYESNHTFNQGTPLPEIIESLPSTVTIHVGDEEYTVDITSYDYQTADYNFILETAQTFIVTATFDTPEGILNGAFLYPEFTIDVLSYRDSNIGLESAYALEPINLDYGVVDSIDAIIDTHLPSQIDVLTEADTTVSVDVSWALDEGAFDNTIEQSQTFTFTGTVSSVPDGYHNLDDVQADIQVVILKAPNVLEIPSGQIHVQANIPEAVEINLTTEPVESLTRVTIDVTVDPDYTFVRMYLYHSNYTFTTDTTYSQLVSETSEFHVVVEVEEIERIDLSTAFDSGNGSETQPFVIVNTEQLNNMRYFLDKGYHFVLGNDITFNEGESFNPMTSPNDKKPFSGVFDGNNYTIYNYNVQITDADEEQHSAFIDINEGTIKNVSFDNMHVVNEHDIIDGSLVAENRENGIIDNVSIDGYRSGRGGGFVGRNKGLISNVDSNLTLENANAAIAFINNNLIQDSTVNTTITIHQKGLGYIGGVVGSNVAVLDETPAVINNVDATVHIQYQIEDSSFDDDTDIGGFVYLNKGDLENTLQAIISNSTVDILIESLIEYRLGLMGGFVTINDNLGVVNHSTASGDLYGKQELGGFVAINQDGISPGTITYSTSNVNVYGTSNTIGGFVAHNRGEAVTATYKGYILESESNGNVEGTNLVGSFAGKQNGWIENSDGFGTVTIIE
ncbi:MAG: hypothetical protein ACOC1L_05495 [Bacillota bacterium]